MKKTRIPILLFAIPYPYHCNATLILLATTALRW